MTESVTSTVEPAAPGSPGAGAPAGAPRIVLGVVALDTDEPRRLADFYATLLGWEMTRADDDWVEIHPGPSSGDEATGSAAISTGLSGAGLAFQLVIDYVPPTWPTQSVPQQFHLDLDVADLDEGEAFACGLGAQRVANAGIEGRFRVFRDPSGHPFCLCKAG